MADLSAASLSQATQAFEDAGFGKGKDFLTTELDVTDSKGVDDWVKGTVERFGGRLDGGVNLAGVIRGSCLLPSCRGCAESVVAKSIHIDGVQDLKDDEWRMVIDINLTGGTYITALIDGSGVRADEMA